MFRLSSPGHHQALSHYRGNCTIYGTIRYVTIQIIIIIIIIIKRDLVLSIKDSANIFFLFVNMEQMFNIEKDVNRSFYRQN